MLTIDALATDPALHNQYHWAVIAHAVKTGIEAGTWDQHRFPSANDALAAVASIQGMTLNTLRRQLAVIDFLLRVDGQQGLQAAWTQAPPFNALEIVKRLYEVDSDEALKVLPVVLNRHMTFGAVNEAYQRALQNIPALNSLAQRREQIVGVEKAAIEALNLGRETLYLTDPPSWIGRKRFKFKDFPFAAPDAIALWPADHHGQKRADAIEVTVSADAPPHLVWKTFERLHLLCTFFTQTWLILPDPYTDQAKAFLQAVLSMNQKLALPSVGIATLKVREKQVYSLVRPNGPPSIDRRHLLPL